MTLLLCLVGLGLSAYLTYVHYTGDAVLSCPDTGRINCAKVTTSAESVLPGHVPVALAGLLFYLAMTALCSPPAWRSVHRAVPAMRLLGGGAGMVMVLWLVYAEFVRIGAICLYCTAVHATTFALFLALCLAWALAPAHPSPAPASSRSRLGP